MHLHIYQADCEWINNTESVIKNKNLKVLKGKQTEKICQTVFDTFPYSTHNL